MKKILLLCALAFAIPSFAVVTTTTNRVSYTGNGSTTAFAFTFPAQATTDVEAYLGGVKQTSGYTVVLNANQTTNPGGTVTFTAAPASSVAVRIQRTVPLTQGTAVGAYTAFPSRTIERSLDKLAMQNQQIDRRVEDAETVHSTDKAVQDSVNAAQSVKDSQQDSFWGNAIAGLNSGTAATNSLSSVLSTGSSTPRTLAARFADTVNAKDHGVVSDGATDDTAAILALFTTLGSSFRGTVWIPYNTKFDVPTVYAAAPVGVILLDDSSINWGQPPVYRNKFRVQYTNDTVSDDSGLWIAAGHHPALFFNNFGTAGSTLGNRRGSSILYGAGQDPFGDPMLGFIVQHAKDPTADTWRISWRLQTPFDVATTVTLWAATHAYSAGDYVVTSAGRVYLCTVGGTSGSTAPSHTSGTATDGTVTWQFYQSALNIDSTRMDLSENGALGLYGPTTGRLSISGGARSAYLEVDGTSHDVALRDVSRGLDAIRITDSAGLFYGMVPSVKFYNLNNAGATPTLPTQGAYITNSAPQTITNFVLNGTQNEGAVVVWFGDGNTTINHGGNFVLKGAANITPAANSIVTFIKRGSISGAWIEVSRNF